MTDQEHRAVYIEFIGAVLDLTKQAKAQGLTGQEIWDYLKFAITKMTGVSEGIAAYIIRDAWEQGQEQRAYKPDRVKFNSYIEWRQNNPHGTYADYRKAQENNQ